VCALGESKGRVGGADAAARMGINRTTILSHMKKFGIDPRTLRDPFIKHGFWGRGLMVVI
jgi:hypothetical protein